jgi:hypothetical protein
MILVNTKPEEQAKRKEFYKRMQSLYDNMKGQIAALKKKVPHGLSSDVDFLFHDAHMPTPANKEFVPTEEPYAEWWKKMYLERNTHNVHSFMAGHI